MISADDPIADVIARAREDRGRFDRFLSHLRAADATFAHASSLYPADMGEWQGAVDPLTRVRRGVGRAGRRRQVGPLAGSGDRGADSPRRAWSSSELAFMQWAAHLWDVDRWPARFPYSFERFYFHRWISALHLRSTPLPSRRSAGRAA